MGCSTSERFYSLPAFDDVGGLLPRLRVHIEVEQRPANRIVLPIACGAHLGRESPAPRGPTRGFLTRRPACRAGKGTPCVTGQFDRWTSPGSAIASGMRSTPGFASPQRARGVRLRQVQIGSGVRVDPGAEPQLAAAMGGAFGNVNAPGPAAECEHRVRLESGHGRRPAATQRHRDRTRRWRPQLPRRRPTPAQCPQTSGRAGWEPPANGLPAPLPCQSRRCALGSHHLSNSAAGLCRLGDSAATDGVGTPGQSSSTG